MYRLENATTYFDIDDYVSSFETGLPSISYKFNDIIGDGSELSGTGTLEGRKIKLARSFVKSKSGRDDFIEWFTKPFYDTIYLRKTSTSFDGIQRVYPALEGGETYQAKNYNFTKEMNFILYMPDPYFESTTVTTNSFTLDSTNTLSTSITIVGRKINPTIEYSSSNTVGSFSIITSNNYGISIIYSLSTGNIMRITTTNSEINLYINDVLNNGYISSNSVPLELITGVNNIYISGNGGTVNLKYYQRQL